ncbi:uncharacterized protein LACBIDRAFT_333890 [Laccaria bicolor S238N-H82]|uniref:Predicted protein n=1 Tax=Laccaria bicolor (strain S238N-H82 / ATCC MYA-4686) TaxID=486041 RepID=B0DXE7_LACBS|nr:uncharacterized protein LACBIDRAFT_333890 [Laccaria bicolor S238N-H82]EDR00823.1 predicted protein [Laccaria bicolor S238N-H82]|eukprot:XP_001888615.1 predicted protein [Laccaria bicolor S238N-H82]
MRIRPIQTQTELVLSSLWGLVQLLLNLPNPPVPLLPPHLLLLKRMLHPINSFVHILINFIDNPSNPLPHLAQFSLTREPASLNRYALQRKSAVWDNAPNHATRPYAGWFRGVWEGRKENKQNDEEKVLDVITPHEPIPDWRNEGDYNCKVEFVPCAGSNLLRWRLILILLILITRRPTLILRFEAHIRVLFLPVFPSQKFFRSERVQGGRAVVFQFCVVCQEASFTILRWLRLLHVHNRLDRAVCKWTCLRN